MAPETARVGAASEIITEAILRARPECRQWPIFGRVHVLAFEGELFATVTEGLEAAAGGPTVVASFANGVTGYLMERADHDEGGYERTWALFRPEDVSALRTAALALVARGDSAG